MQQMKAWQDIVAKKSTNTPSHV